MTIDRQSVLRSLRDTTSFTLTEEHLTLLREAYVAWSDVEYGAPEIDPKRPYGNSSVPQDVAEALGWTWDGDELPDALIERADRIHAETALALQICLSLGQFKAGRYERPSGYGRHEWRLVEEMP